jgi:hypothetical protein
MLAACCASLKHSRAPEDRPSSFEQLRMSLPTSLRAPLRALDEALIPRRLFRARKIDGRVVASYTQRSTNMQFQGTVNNVKLVG